LETVSKVTWKAIFRRKQRRGSRYTRPRKLTGTKDHGKTNS